VADLERNGWPTWCGIPTLGKANDYYYRVRNTKPGIGKSLLIYCGLIASLSDYHFADTRAKASKSAESHVATIEEIHKSRLLVAAKRRHKPTKKNQLEQYIPDILESRREGISYNSIATWLLEEHKIDISSEYIRRVVGNGNRKTDR
jgi:hypothetical protein